jgi:hypothetical protein
MGIKLSEHQRRAMFLAAGTIDAGSTEDNDLHIGKRTWHALKKKGVVECVPEDDDQMRWRLTPYGWRKLKEIHTKRKRDAAV